MQAHVDVHRPDSDEQCHQAPSGCGARASKHETIRDEDADAAQNLGDAGEIDHSQGPRDVWRHRANIKTGIHEVKGAREDEKDSKEQQTCPPQSPVKSRRFPLAHLSPNVSRICCCVKGGQLLRLTRYNARPSGNVPSVPEFRISYDLCLISFEV
jgi:hypothetical protein